MTEVKVDPGICGFVTTIKIESEDKISADIIIDTACPHVKKMAEEIKNVDCMGESFAKFNVSNIYKVASTTLKHVACPVPSAIIKGIEVASGFALPKDVTMQIKNI